MGRLLFAAALACAGCSSSWVTMQAQHVDVVSADGSHYWVTGSLGYAAEGRGARLSRADFVASSDEPDWAFEASMFPGGHVVELAGTTYLITHGGGILRREAGGWRRLENAVPPEYEGSPAQVDRVLRAPDGTVVIHAHAQRLWFADAVALERGGMRREDMGEYTWELGFVRGRIVGTSYDGDRRAIFERVAPRQWEVRGVLPRAASEVVAVIPFGDRGLAAVTYHGLNVVDAPGVRVPTRFVRADDLVDLRKREPVAPARKTLTIASEAPETSAPEVPSPPAEELPARGEPGRPTVAVVVPAEPEGERTDGAPIGGAFVLPSGRVVLAVGSTATTDPGVVLLEATTARFFRCDLLSVRRVVGVVEAGDHLLAVSTEGAVLELFAERSCTEPQPPTIPTER